MVLAEVEQYAALGISEVQVMPDPGRPVADFTDELVTKVLPRLKIIG